MWVVLKFNKTKSSKNFWRQDFEYENEKHFIKFAIETFSLLFPI